MYTEMRGYRCSYKLDGRRGGVDQLFPWRCAGKSSCYLASPFNEVARSSVALEELDGVKEFDHFYAVVGTVMRGVWGVWGSKDTKLLLPVIKL